MKRWLRATFRVAPSSLGRLDRQRKNYDTKDCTQSPYFCYSPERSAKPENSEPHLETLPDELPPQQSKPVTRRKIRPEESLGFCNHCKEWTPLIWLPKEERGKKAESWFMCEVCSGRSIILRYLSGKEAVARNMQFQSSSSDLRTSTRKGVQRVLQARATHP